MSSIINTARCATILQLTCVIICMPLNHRINNARQARAINRETQDIDEKTEVGWIKAGQKLKERKLIFLNNLVKMKLVNNNIFGNLRFNF